MKLEFHRWPPQHVGGQQVSASNVGVLAIDTETGVAVCVSAERSQHANQLLAEERVKLLLRDLPWSTAW